MQGYLNGTLVGLIDCVITSTTGSTILVGTIGVTSFFFLVVTSLFGMTFFTTV
jgi:hypothetical protein